MFDTLKKGGYIIYGGIDDLRCFYHSNDEWNWENAAFSKKYEDII